MKDKPKDKIEIENSKILFKVQEEEEEMKEVQKEIRDLEMELDFAESQASDDYKYISNIENRLDNLYEKFNQLDEQ